MPQRSFQILGINLVGLLGAGAERNSRNESGLWIIGKPEPGYPFARLEADVDLSEPHIILSLALACATKPSLLYSGRCCARLRPATSIR